MPHAVGIFGFPVVIQLQSHGFAVFLHDPDQPDTRCFGPTFLNHPGQAVENFQIIFHLGVNIRPLHLDDHLLPALEDSSVHLADGSGSQRLGVEKGKDLFYRPDLISYHSLNLVHRHRCHLILQAFQLGHEFRRQYVRAGAEHLPELDKGRPQLHQGMGQFVRHAIVRFQLTSANRI